MASDILYTLGVVTAIIFFLICIRSILFRRAKTTQRERVAEMLRGVEEGRIPPPRWAGATHVNSIPRPPPVHVHPNTHEEVAIELPIYEAPPPKYENVIKETQPPVEMRDLERGEPSGRAEAETNPPEYNQEAGGDERIVVVRVATDGSRTTVPEGEPRGGLFSMTRPFYGNGLLGRPWR